MTTWNAVFLAGYVVYVVMRGVWIERTKRVERVVRKVDGLDRGLMFLVSLGTIVAPILYLATPWLAFADYALPKFAPWLGTAAMIVSLWLFWRSHSDLGANWSVTLELRKEHAIVQNGVYRRIRHPMYAAIFLFCVAQGLMLANWLAGWAALVTFAALYFGRMPREEAMLLEAFGPEYREYMQRTGRLVPRLRQGRRASVAP